MKQFTIDDVLSTFTNIDLDRTNVHPDREKFSDINPMTSVPFCVYAEDGRPGCIAGHAAITLDPALLGVLAPLAATWTGNSMPNFVKRNFTDEANELLGRLQTQADSFRTWREALKSAGYEVQTTTSHVITKRAA